MSPFEISSILPHPVEDDGEFPGDRDARFLAAGACGDLHAPGLERTGLVVRESKTPAAPNR